MRRKTFGKTTRCIIGVILFVGLLSGGAIVSAEQGARSEEAAVLKAARHYLDAEVKKDYPRIYACLSPSSAYCTSHTYDEYLEEARSSAASVSTYEIIAVTYIRENDNREKFPSVDKFAEVEVEVVVHYSDTNTSSEYNIGFIFMKEGGKWYKS